jgi:hypothetical protein
MGAELSGAVTHKSFNAQINLFCLPKVFLLANLAKYNVVL